MNKIAILTATYNIEKDIPNLINCLNSQISQDFKWYIIDNLSSDRTLDMIKKYCNVNYSIISEKDHGIYDALNKGIKVIDEDYYLVLGGDDYIYPETIKRFHSTIKNNPNLVFSKWEVASKVLSPKKKLGWLYGMLGIGSSHSVATLINKKLHSSIGLYDLRFKMCADQYFIKQAYNYNKKKIVYENFISGKFNNTGYSSTNIFQYINELFLIQIKTEKFKLLQLFFYILRIFKHWKKIINFND